MDYPVHAVEVEVVVAEVAYALALFVCMYVHVGCERDLQQTSEGGGGGL